MKTMIRAGALLLLGSLAIGCSASSMIKSDVSPAASNTKPSTLSNTAIPVIEQ